MSYRWEHFTTFIATNPLDGREGRHGQFVREFASAVSMFQGRYSDLLEMYADVLKIIEELSTCPYESAAFGGRLEALQKVVGIRKL